MVLVGNLGSERHKEKCGKGERVEEENERHIAEM
jgi:hypothetical protein